MNAHSLQSLLLPAPAKLNDGRTVLVRAMMPGDETRLCRLFRRLSPETVYRRFMVANPKIGSAQLARLVDIDHADREALVVTLHGEIHAVARYHRNPGERDAEIAVVVEDRWQRRGIGRILFTRLAELARTRGVESFTGTMLAENAGATRLLVSVFPTAERQIRQGELVFRVPLTDGAVSQASSF